MSEEKNNLTREHADVINKNVSVPEEMIENYGLTKIYNDSPPKNIDFVCEQEKTITLFKEM